MGLSQNGNNPKQLLSVAPNTGILNPDSKCGETDRCVSLRVMTDTTRRCLLFAPPLDVLDASSHELVMHIGPTPSAFLALSSGSRHHRASPYRLIVCLVQL